MVGTSQILTVSYGTFSCTLEGFEEPFNTMTAIAEYFRDLAADDRYFGAEPPTPDAEMLHRLAERTINKSVQARVSENSITLRPTDTIAGGDGREAETGDRGALAASPVEMPAAETAAAEDTLRTEAQQIEAQAAEDPTVTAAQALAADEHEGDDASEVIVSAETVAAEDDDGDEDAAEATAPAQVESVAAKLARIRAVVEQDSLASEYTEDEHAGADAFFAGSGPSETEEEPSMASDLIYDLGTPADEILAGPGQSGQGGAEDDAPVAEGAEADADEGADAEPLALSAQEEPVLTDAQERDDEAWMPEEEDTAATAPAAEDTAERPATLAEDPAEVPAEAVAGPMNQDDAEVAGEETTDDAVAEHDAAAEVLDAETHAETVVIVAEEESVTEDTAEVAAAEAGEETGQETGEDALEAALQDEDLDDGFDEDTLLATLAAESAAEEERLSTETDAIEMAGHDEDQEHEVETRPDEINLLDEEQFGTAGTDAPTLYATEGEDTVEEDTAAEDRVAGEFDDLPDLESYLSDAEAPASEPHGAAEDTAQVEATDTQDAQEEQDATAETEEAPEAGPRTRSGRRIRVLRVRRGQDDHGDRTVSTQLGDTAEDTAENTAADGEDAAEAVEEPRKSVHLRRPSELGTSARDQLTPSDSAEDDAAVNRIMATADDKLRGDDTRRRISAISHLKAAVAATRAERRDARAAKRGGDASREYRKDLEAVVGTGTPAREGEKRGTPLVLVTEQRVDTRSTGGETERASDRAPARDSGETPTSFAEYAEIVGASDLSDLLEAAAVYVSYVEGRPHFSRPEIMEHVAETERSFSREDGLRSFGTLLRSGTIRKLKRGQFVISEDSKFAQDERAAG